MLTLSKKSSLALEAVLDIAYNSRPHPVQSKDITERQGIPQRYLEQVLQKLVRAGVLKGVRGPRGGYTLAKERRRITLGDVLRVVDQMSRDEGDSPTHSPLGEIIIGPIRDAVQHEVLQKFDELTMEDLCEKAVKAGIDRVDKDKNDFTI
ncbi:MAG: Rrf2 family transcriptional regulator [Rhodobacteraceae bacterium]|nr:Rrf2 family transcriptional regulator [Paracoccaceae bacterium]